MIIYFVMQIIRAKPEDADVLTQIAIRAKRHWNYPESWIENWRGDLAVGMECILKHEVHSAIVNGQIVGFYTLAAEGDKLRLEDLWVLPEMMGQGVGRHLFMHALKRAKDRGFGALEIESDPNAEGFYLRMGAYRVGLRIRELTMQRRELPLLICQTDQAI
jgi:GNAT superfamily N-acetyltransferase